MIAKIIIGFLAIIGVVNILNSIIVLVFPKSRAAKFIIKYGGITINTETDEIIK